MVTKLCSDVAMVVDLDARKVETMIGMRKRKSEESMGDKETTEQALGASEETLGASEEAASAEESPRPAKRVLVDDVDEEDAAALAIKLTDFVYGERPVVVERLAIEYVVEMRMDPRVDLDEFVAYIRSEYPSAPIKTIEKTWIKLKRFFDGEHKAQYMVIEALADVEKMVDTFLAAANVEEEEEHRETPADSSNRVQSSASRNTRSTPTRSTRKNSNTSGSSSGSLKLELLATMRHEYEQVFDRFKGESWTLPSGQKLDDLVRPFVLSLTAESMMHSCIIDNVDMVVGLVQEQVDKDELLRVLDDDEGDNERAWLLTEAEQAFINLYDKSPTEVNRLISIGYTGVLAEGKNLTEAPDAAFCDEVHSLIDRLRSIYKRNQYQLPEKQSEAWYGGNHWGILNDIFNVPEAIKYQPGEICCEASGRRKNDQRTSPLVKQQCGRKADGIVKSATKSYELAIMEATKIENGPQGTKAMTDTVKLGKMMKDCFDLIRRNSRTDVRHRLAIYGMKISAGMITFYRLRHRHGRFFQLTCEGSVAFPAVWRTDGANTSEILTVITLLLAFQRQIKAMARMVSDLTSAKFKLNKATSGKADNKWPCTLTTPGSSPRMCPTTPPTLPPPVAIPAPASTL
ncbi:hypothetical protein BC939DRAFT_445601 [Gamsiella multidivaricata]|uniref:uncharacterized protein n=1 Tax=Gamsiella multidivaricata TaxID=101098 RepID=UPI002220D18C|nr:uncharacterized protein BC939DRAFT_445601 [Gamsiella multidivaricata]KAG0364617.1 hypothetical protein BGZ54_007330 [Gamsiella multidivaricata]KAI7827035.1 hypothetical protein BC939DRAFT_445601 [Gamsiella multidivaricata]